MSPEQYGIDGASDDFGGSVGAQLVGAMLQDKPSMATGPQVIRITTDQNNVRKISGECLNGILVTENELVREFGLNCSPPGVGKGDNGIVSEWFEQ